MGQKQLQVGQWTKNCVFPPLKLNHSSWDIDNSYMGASRNMFTIPFMDVCIVTTSIRPFFNISGKMKVYLSTFKLLLYLKENSHRKWGISGGLMKWRRYERDTSVFSAAYLSHVSAVDGWRPSEPWSVAASSSKLLLGEMGIHTHTSWAHMHAPQTYTKTNTHMLRHLSEARDLNWEEEDIKMYRFETCWIEDVFT